MPKSSKRDSRDDLLEWAEVLGEALGRGIARGLHANLGALGLALNQPAAPRRRGRPPKPFFGTPAPADRRCQAPGCPRPARSKGLCSAHYQAERRRKPTKT